jgi:hypothetical protein
LQLKLALYGTPPMVVVGAPSIQTGSTPELANEKNAGMASKVATEPPSPEREQLLLAEYTSPLAPLNWSTFSQLRVIPAPPSSCVLSLSFSSSNDMMRQRSLSRMMISGSMAATSFLKSSSDSASTSGLISSGL